MNRGITRQRRECFQRRRCFAVMWQSNAWFPQLSLKYLIKRFGYCPSIFMIFLYFLDFLLFLWFSCTFLIFSFSFLFLFFSLSLSLSLSLLFMSFSFFSFFSLLSLILCLSLSPFIQGELSAAVAEQRVVLRTMDQLFGSDVRHMILFSTSQFYFFILY